MRYRPALLLFALFLAGAVSGQSYQSYFTGNPADAVTRPTGGICLMGGSTENDEAMRWFLRSANGGDVLVLRASGSDGYNEYLYSELGVPVNSVETVVFKDGSASREAYIHDKIENAEAIWIAGGRRPTVRMAPPRCGSSGWIRNGGLDAHPVVADRTIASSASRSAPPLMPPSAPAF